MKTRKDMSNVSCRRDMTEILFENGVKHDSINQSMID